jgi:Glycosyl hydrolases family 25
LLKSPQSYKKRDWVRLHPSRGTLRYFLIKVFGANKIHLICKGQLLPIVDVELDCPNCTTPGIPTDQMIANLKKYIAAIEAHYKVKPIIYTYQGFYHTYLKGHCRICGYEFFDR